MDFERLNAIAKGVRRTMKRVSELELNRPYLIEGLVRATTKYGTKVTADLEGNIYCYLPCRVSRDLLANEEQQLRIFQQQLQDTTVTLKRIDGRWNPIEFGFPVPDEAQNNL